MSEEITPAEKAHCRRMQLRSDVMGCIGFLQGTLENIERCPAERLPEVSAAALAKLSMLRLCVEELVPCETNPSGSYCLFRPVLDWPTEEGWWWCEAEGLPDLVEADVHEDAVEIYDGDKWTLSVHGPARFVKLLESNPFTSESMSEPEPEPEPDSDKREQLIAALDWIIRDLSQGKQPSVQAIDTLIEIQRWMQEATNAKQ